MILLVTEGKMEHWLDFQVHHLLKNQMVYVSPSQVQHFIQTRMKQNNAVLFLFRPELLPNELMTAITSETSGWSTMGFCWPRVTTLKPQQAHFFQQQLTRLRELDAGNGHELTASCLACSAIAFAFEVVLSNSVSGNAKQPDQRLLDFLDLIEDTFAKRRDVKWYAKKLECSERTLDRSCLRIVGKSAKAVVTDRVLIEAKRILTYSDDSISSIGESLGFPETTNFVRFFKNNAGITPAAFRKRFLNG